MASKSKRGLSVEEKRSRLLDLFYQKKDFFLLKELEKIAPKEKGIVSQSVKDVLQSLVDDNLVDTEKIGTSVYFWAFPSKATANRKRKLKETEDKLDDTTSKLETAREGLKEAKRGKQDGSERDEALAKLAELTSQKVDLLNQLRKYEDCDPEVLVKLETEKLQAMESANRWTDNIFALQAWIGRNFPTISVAALNSQFGIPGDLDYLPTKE